MMKRIYSFLERYLEILEEDYKFIVKCFKYLGFNNLVNFLDLILVR